MNRTLLLPTLLLAGCLAPAALVPMPHNQDGGRQPARVEAVPDRCAALAEPQREQECGQARVEAIRFVRKLAVEDQICLEGNPLGDRITSRCTVRAFVEDVGPKAIKLEIRETPPGSRFDPMHDYWYHEDALVDLYLESLGFLRKGQ